MAWNRDNHGSRSRDRGRRDDFGEPAYEPPRSSSPRSAGPSSFDRQMVSQANVSATVKWFNASKGFGFVAPSDGSPDAFLHISALERAGLSQVAEGTTLVVDLGQGQRGPQVVTVHEVDASTAVARAPRREERGPTQTVEGVVKFFSAEKGFGFVACDEGGKDVFVHVKALERSGIGALESGQRVRVTTTLGLKGPQADTVEVIA
ncbi:cold-shock protein [Paramagnetospirillum marisnigri]|uniref:Cold-shock protein n=1 Tax=Paramagnetospirillum marisnigri TaxID=1285242 RepID=A0A178MSH1_9PROT|nr:cold shock domain-containing protein [Paramagnetospirillum marisnigri]OAN52202.1 cold-shock protein [Paramagnetospirillum marisnigri]